MGGITVLVVRVMGVNTGCVVVICPVWAVVFAGWLITIKPMNIPTPITTTQAQIATFSNNPAGSF